MMIYNSFIPVNDNFRTQMLAFAILSFSSQSERANRK